jgi:hypothetical protein
MRRIEKRWKESFLYSVSFLADEVSQLHQRYNFITKYARRQQAAFAARVAAASYTWLKSSGSSFVLDFFIA